MKLTTFAEEIFSPDRTAMTMPWDTPICQTDYPLDWYQPAFVRYAEEYQALPDRTLATIIPWMAQYIKPAQAYFGDSLLLLAHYYMGGEIVKMVQYFGGEVGDSYQLALKAVQHREKKIIIESAVHFMAESISILANKNQRVYITNPKSGCTMEMLAKDFKEHDKKDMQIQLGIASAMAGILIKIICPINHQGTGIPETMEIPIKVRDMNIVVKFSCFDFGGQW